MADLTDFVRVAATDHNFCVVTTARGDGTIQASVVTAGVMAHPASGKEVVVFVARGRSRKLANLRTRPNLTIVASEGGAWTAVEGSVDLIGPDDPRDGYDAEAMRVLLREAFVAAGGTHDDWDEYDRVMAEDRRTVVFVTPTRVYSNG